ncbi:hypothetical protein BKA69DRAFT_1060218 [Paraphysoderma sedebokerense]|nr:hypothetical protein BKA69DRAFT_1060095 [Paraphysoderma sedebokerense]KAI9143574.1 hypothetical protein BKA69DRAFT_1060218 [Paraphysoderma sedebokerense]
MPSPSKLGLALLLASGAFAAPNPNLGSSTNISITVGNNTFNFNNNLTIDTSKWLDAKKLLRVTTTQRRAVIRAMSLNRSVQYFGEYHLSTAGIPNIGARFFLRNEDSTSAFGLRAGLLQLAEVNPDQNIDLAKSSNVIKFAGSTQYWSPINETDVPNTKNVTVKKLSTTFTNTTSPGKPNVTVTIDAFLASEKVTIDGVTYIPRSLKYSLLIENFPYQYANSQLAIVKGVMFRSVDLVYKF